MFKPVRPIVLTRQKGDKRPFMGPAMISARMNGIMSPEDSTELAASEMGKEQILVYWRPKQVPKKQAQKKTTAQETP